MSTVLEIKGLTKRYKAVTALNNLNMTIESGGIYGLLGPNGSGKTTTLGILLNVIHPDDGQFSWFGGLNLQEARRRIGALLETPNFYPYLSGIENLKITCAIKDVSEDRIFPILDQVGLGGRANSKFKTYSLGMKQRLAIAATLISDPDILILDEPTNGLDPQGIKEIRELIIEIGKSGKTIILASHMLDEVEKVCTHVAVLKKGNLLAAGSVEDVLADEERYEIAAADLQLLAQSLMKFPGATNVEKGETTVVATFDREIDPTELSKHLFADDVVPTQLAKKKKSLESQFLELTKE